MVRVKQIEEFNLDLSKNNTILEVSDGKIVNSLTCDSESTANTIVKRDENGRISVESPENDDNAVNKKYVDDAVSNLDISSSLEDSYSIYWQTSEEGKMSPVLDLRSVSEGSLLKVGINSKGKKALFPATYIKEDIENKSVKIRQTSVTISDTLADVNGSALYIEGVKKSNPKSDINIVSASTELDKSAQISLYSFLDKSSAKTVVTGAVKNGQLISKISSFGSTSSTTFAEAATISVYADNNFTATEQKAHIELSQLGNVVLSTTSDNQVKVNKGLVLGYDESEKQGLIHFDVNNNHFMGYNGSEWVPLDSTSGDSFVTENIISDYTVGGIKKGDIIYAGENLNDVLNKMLKPDCFSSFVIDFGDTAYAENGDSLEVGQSVTVSKATYETNCDIDFVTIRGNGFDENEEYTESPVVATEETASFDITEGECSWIIDGYVGTPSIESVINDKFTVYGRYRTCFGSSALNALEDSSIVGTILEGLDYELQANFVGTGISFVTDEDNKNSNKFTYFAYPSSWGDLNNVFMHGVPVADAFTKVGEYYYVNPFGIQTKYNLYQSNAKGAYRIGTKLTFK